MNENKININWFPGHMAKAKRLLSDQLGRCDVVIELCDARLPFSSRNPDLARMTNGKKRILLLNKADLADPGITSAWISRFKEQGLDAAPCTSYMNRGKEVLKLIDRAAKEAVEKATDEYKKYQQRTLSDVEKAYLDTIKMLGSKTEKKS